MKVKYKGLVVGMLPAEEFKREVSEGLYACRVLISFNREYDYVDNKWKRVENKEAKVERNKENYFFEHIWGAVPETVILNNKSGYSLEELREEVKRNKEKGKANKIKRCILRDERGREIEIQNEEKEGSKEISKVEVEGQGPMYLRYNRKTNLPYCNKFTGDILYHLYNPSIKVIKRVILKEER